MDFSFKDVRDKNGYLEALGRPRIAAVKRDADIAEAQAVRDTEIQTSKAREGGASKASNYVTNLMAQTPEMVKQVSGIDLNQLIQDLITQ
ncbi:hypothetical protein [Thermoactinomyces mirandus]|uniref:hypothetical protein n=1 Tax=Thermoactinomyces mirandus TaxID=2756294 RepID=UPI0035E4652D